MNMKKLLSLSAALALCMALWVSSALAAGNVTIAAQGLNGFEDYLQDMWVWNGSLLMTSWNEVYTWSPEDRQLTTFDGLTALRESLYSTEQYRQDGMNIVVLGEETIEMDEDESLSVDSTLLVIGDKLYQSVTVYGEYGVSRTLYVELCMAQDGTFSVGNVIDMGDALLTRYDDGYAWSRQLEATCYEDGILYAISYGDVGTELLAVDMEAASSDVLELDTDGYLSGLAAYESGKLLLEIVMDEDEGSAAQLMVYDIAGETLSTLGELPTQNYNVPSGIVYDAARSRLYYTLAGSVWRMDISEDGLGEPEAFGDMPLTAYSSNVAVLMDDLYILCSYDGVVGRDVTQEQLPEQTLTIANTSYIGAIQSAYYTFTDAHPEYMVTISDSSDSDILQSMMNRSSDVDIYTLDVTSGEFITLLNRGFMAELTQSDALSDVVSAMYAPLQAISRKDGELYAVPMEMYSNCTMLNKKLLIEKFGYDEDEIPTSWPQLLALLAELSQGKMEEVPEASLMDPYYTRDDARLSIFMMMMRDFLLWLDQEDTDSSEMSAVLMQLCEAFEQINWDGFGMKEEYEDEDIWEYDSNNILLDTAYLTISNRSGDSDAMVYMPLAVVDGGAPLLGINVTMAFVNPFSTHREAAIEYLEDAVALLDTSTLMNMTPDMNEPIASTYYEDTLKYYDDTIAQMQQSLEKAEDEETRDSLNEYLESLNEWRAYYEENGRWSLSEADIQAYRALDSTFAVSKTAIWTSDFYSRFSQYLDGAVSAQQLADELEKSIRMQQLEGM